MACLTKELMSLIKGTDLYPENEHRLRNVAEGNDELV